MKGNGVIIRRRVLMVMSRDSLNDKGNEASNESREEKGSNGPDEDLAAHNDATQIHVLLLLLFGGSEEPALLCLVQWS